MQEPETTDQKAGPLPGRRRKWKRWAVPIVLAGGLVWLNGPGLRWLAPIAADHFLPMAGFRGSFALDGRLSDGLTVRDLRLESGKALGLLTVDRITLDYRLGQLVKGRLSGIEIDGAHAELRLGIADEAPREPKPLDLERLVATIRAARSQVIAVEADLKGLSLNVTQDGKPVLSLARTHIRHRAGEPVVDLEIGAITDATGHEWPAREAAINWNEEDLRINRLDPLPGVGVRNLVARLPASGGPSAETELHLDDAVFLVNASPGFSSIQISLREGRLASGTLAGHFNIEPPASGELTSLTANVDNLLPDPKAATGSLQVLLENIAHGDWRVAELSLDATLEADRAAVAARAAVLDTTVSLKAGAELSRDAGSLVLGETRGNFSVAEVSKLVAALAARSKAIDPEAAAPESALEGGFTVLFSNNKPASADLDLVLKPAAPEAASSVAVTAKWHPEQPVSAVVELEGLKANADYDIENSSYQGGLTLSDFKSARIDPWLDIVKAGTKGAVAVTGNWQGGGSLKDMTHRGALELTELAFTRPDVPAVHARGGIDYDWPRGFTTEDLQVKAADQSVAAKLTMADGFLMLSELLWQDGDKELAAGRAKLPVPEDFSKWRELPAKDSRPLEVSIRSEVLALNSLKDFMPAAEKLDPRSTGQVTLEVSGTYAAPVIDAMLEARDLRSPEQAQLPPADLKLTFAARDGRISIEGNALAKDLPPAVMTASMPFRPAEWAEKPGLVLEEKISARVDLPRIDLSRFASLVPQAKKITGTVTGNLLVAGEIGKPDVKGGIVLTGGGVVLANGDIPPVSDVAAAVDLTLDKITLRNLKASVAGGNLTAGGSLALENGKPGALEFAIKGDHLPLKRDDSLIVRTNADFRLSGTWEQAALTGTAGIVDSLFFKDIELLPIGSPFTGPSAASLPKIDAPSKPADSVPLPFRNWTLDVTAKTENPFLIRGNLASGKVVANIKVGGTVGNPAPDGEVRISDFKASLPFSTLTIAKGTVKFTPANGFDPVLEIRGSAEPRPYQVSVFVHGRASDPQLVLTSSPPLPENEIMTLLATGTTTTGLADPQAASTRALQLFAEELRRGRFAVGKQLRPLLGLLDRVDFSVAEKDPYSSASYSTATLELSDRWFLSAGMGGEGDSRVLAIWRLRFY